MHPAAHPQALPAGPARDALRQAADDVDRASAGGQPFAISHALAQLARCYRGAGAIDAAEASYEQALLWGRYVGAADLTVDLLCDLCELAATRAERLDNGDRESSRGHAAREQARERAFEASQLAGHVADPRWEVQVLLRVSDVLDRCGNRDDAVALQTRALRLMNGDHAPLHDPKLLPGTQAG